MQTVVNLLYDPNVLLFFTIGANTDLSAENCLARTSVLEFVNISPQNTKYTSVEGVIFTKDMKTLVKYPAKKTDKTTYVIPDAVETIKSQAFQFSQLTSIEIPNSVTSIGDHAFNVCTSLTSITYCGVIYTNNTTFNNIVKTDGAAATTNIWFK